MSSTKRKAPPVRIAKPRITTSAKPTTRPRLNDKLSVVAVPKQQQKQSKKSDAAIEISSDEDEDDIDEDDVEVDETTKIGEQDTDMADIPQTNGAEKDDVNDDSNDDDADAEPTFGDLVREHGTVDVAAALGLLNPADGNASAVVKGSAAGAAAPNLASLGQLLNAALRSGDDANLELCFTTTSSTDSSWVRNTIQRLDPSLAGTLLQKLAARIHRRPGRAHTLIGWVQWTLITHGGALLTNQPGVTTRALQELHRVLEERARGLNSLLLLKGKLDMLEAQMQLRRVQRGGRAFAGIGGDAYQADAAAVGRVASSAVDGINGRRAGRRRRGVTGGPSKGSSQPGFKVYREGRDDLEEHDEDEDEDEAGHILVNGAEIAGESFIDGSDDDVEALDEEDDEDSDEDDEDGDDAEDDDLEEEDDDAEEDEVNFDDVDDEDDDDDDDDEIEESATAAPPPAKMQKKSGGAFSKRR
ncbi:small nucleolar ribonucleoprotein complex component [Ophiostoma piceae UAMH 11346]|uniref:Small nucleolar ribonucleoprotein complex component n=1 Tax=Ophiostoma piceae (strain UAMH 11346) TaxID=1262450 RepID=S3CN05_OPHP1|nr:small nucleolar ribonucleoprotein complex component [Ophiostoma piceae UAMH 11346]